MNRTNRRKRPRRLAYEDRLTLLALLAAGPVTIVAMTLVWTSAFSLGARSTLTVVIGLFLWGGLAALRQRARFPLRTLANLVAAIREGDFSIRARGGGARDAMSELTGELNALAERLRGQRLDSLEAAGLLRSVMAEIEVAVFAFDPQRRLILINRAGEKLLARPAGQLLSRSATELGLAECLEGDASRILSRSFPGGGDRWSMRRGSFRQSGVQNQLLVLTDLSRALREEERQAWQRLLRVLGHELNNSLAPIKSIAASLEELLGRERKPDDWPEDVRAGLAVISSRTAAITRFMEAYSKLAKLPPPNFQRVALDALIRRVAGLELRVRVEVELGPEVTVAADPDQLEQLLINVLRNAADAALETRGVRRRSGEAAEVRVRWSVHNDCAEIRIEDQGPGIANPANLFVPFFTTKPGGSGIGLVLARQIAEAHGGSLILGNLKDKSGCAATLRLRIHEAAKSV